MNSSHRLMRKPWCNSSKCPNKGYNCCLFEINLQSTNKLLLLPTHGGLAHLARALAWQARGDRFESGILHSKY